MKTSKDTAPRPAFIDPHNVPVSVVDAITFHGLTSGLLDITCCAVRKTPHGENITVSEAVVVARLRLNVGLAALMRDALARHIENAKGVQTNGPGSAQGSSVGTLN